MIARPFILDCRWVGTARAVVACQLLPGRSFVMGCDTAIRIVNPMYYEEQKVENMVAALMGIYCDGGCVLRQT